MVLLANLEHCLTSLLAARLSETGNACHVAESREEVEGLLTGGTPCSLALLSISRVNWEADVALIERLRRKTGAPLIAIASESCEALAIAVFRAGAANYFRQPVAAQEIWQAVLDNLGNAPLRPLARSQEDAPAGLPAGAELAGGEAMIGNCAEIQRVRASLARLAQSESNVLITGETGTGKELAADLIHRNSRRAKGPLVCLNCAAVPDALLESELFGYERGAFTGAQTPTAGQMEHAAGGTIFFDEVGEMSPHAQAKLLRALETKEVYRLGSRRKIRVDARVIAATNRDLDTLAQTNEFRRDLYYRLNVGRIHLPPLRRRRGDIPALVNHLLAQLGGSSASLSDEVREALTTYSWPGNVRELRNVLESSLVGLARSTVRFVDLPDWFKNQLKLQQADSNRECDRLIAELEKAHWNKTRTARALSWSRTTLYRKLDQYNLR